MTDRRLDGPRWKLQRAREHHEALHGLIREFLTKPDLYRIALDQDRKGRLVTRVATVEPIPIEVILRVGECAHQMRSALDHLMFALAAPRNEREEQHVQFPIVSRRREWNSTTRLMPGTPRGLRTVTERLQPYHRRKWPDTYGLWQLRQLDNWDKHRLLVSSLAMIEGSRLNIRTEGATTVLSEEAVRGPLEAGAVIAQLRMGQSEVGAKVYVDPHMSLLIRFDERMPKGIAGEPVLATLANIGTFIQEEIVPRFEKLLP